MKNKIITILEKPRTIIPVVFIVAVIVGIFVYRYAGHSPVIKLDNHNISSISQESIDFKNGQEVSLAFPKTGRVNKIYVKSGDIVNKGQMLAELESTDTLGSLKIAEANYQKVVNGATGPDIDVAKTAVETAQTNLDSTIKQQELAVQTAHNNLLNSTPEVVPEDGTSDYTAPTISGTYNLGKEGTINLHMYYSSGGVSYTVSGLTQGSGKVNIITSQPIGNSGLYIKFPSDKMMDTSDWVITIPNNKASNYLANYNAYQTALDTQTRSVDLAKASLNQVQSTLTLKQSKARPEDIASAQGALEVAKSAYDNNFIYAPVDGVISVVNIQVGEIAFTNQKAVGIIANTINN